MPCRKLTSAVAEDTGRFGAAGEPLGSPVLSAVRPARGRAYCQPMVV
jgi:hypothetical protein